MLCSIRVAVPATLKSMVFLQVSFRRCNAKVVGSTPIIGGTFSRKIINLLLKYFALFNSNVQFFAL